MFNIKAEVNTVLNVMRKTGLNAEGYDGRTAVLAFAQAFSEEFEVDEVQTSYLTDVVSESDADVKMAVGFAGKRGFLIFSFEVNNIGASHVRIVGINGAAREVEFKYEHNTAMRNFVAETSKVFNHVGVN